MAESQPRQLILIYYNIRGKLQVIRNLLSHLQLNVVELHLELIETGAERPDEQILNRLRNQPIDRTKLPLLVDQNEFIYGTFAINVHLCTISQRPDLLGRNDSQMRQVHRTLEVLLQSQMKCKTFLFSFAQKCLGKSEREVRQLKHLNYERLMNDFPFIREICELLRGQPEGAFILGTFTLVDLYFWETCFYILGIFGSIDREYTRSDESFYNSIVSSSLQRKSNKMNLEDMRRFAGRMEALPFYQRNKGYLESFSVIYSLMSEEKVEGLRRIWVGDAKYMQ